MRDRTFENQRYRASGLNLVVAAIILWNTVYLERAIRLLQQKGRSISDELLVHLSPLGWEHINLTGDYIWHAPLDFIGSRESVRIHNSEYSGTRNIGKYSVNGIFSVS
jgi:hypothetical protein